MGKNQESESKGMSRRDFLCCAGALFGLAGADQTITTFMKATTHPATPQGRRDLQPDYWTSVGLDSGSYITLRAAALKPREDTGNRPEPQPFIPKKFVTREAMMGKERTQWENYLLKNLNNDIFPEVSFYHFVDGMLRLEGSTGIWHDTRRVFTKELEWPGKDIKIKLSNDELWTGYNASMSFLHETDQMTETIRYVRLFEDVDSERPHLTYSRSYGENMRRRLSKPLISPDEVPLSPSENCIEIPINIETVRDVCHQVLTRNTPKITMK